jgi:RNA polymerase sigma-70 factor (ECF subfamily)
MAGPRNDNATTKHRAFSRPVAVSPRERPTANPLADLDTQIMLQVRAGNRDAAATLIRRNRERIARYLARLIRDPRTVEDLTQDVFLHALAHAGHFTPTATVTTWLYRIATNAALNYLKQPSVRRQAPEPAQGLWEIADQHEPTPERRLNLEELREHVLQALEHLPLNQRVALALFQYEDCSYEQIAAVLDVTVEAVRSLLMRARTTLRRELHGFR